MSGDRGLTLKVLGCAGSAYDHVVANSSYLLESDDAAVLLDCGFGSFGSFHELAGGTRLDAIILSHAHRDHVSDLNAFVGTPEIWRDSSRVIASSSTVEAIVRSYGSLSAGSVTYVDDGSREHGAHYNAEFSTTVHQIPTLGMQITMGGVRVVYSADTGPGWAFPRDFSGADLAIIECTMIRRDESYPFHLDALEAATLIGELSPVSTMITHVPPNESGEERLELVRQFAPGARIGLAHVGHTIELGNVTSL